MNANQIARLMHLATLAFLSQEIPEEEYTDIVHALVNQARERGIGETAKLAYDKMCLDWHAAQKFKAA